ncbi:hypothetical protein P7K49_007475, partial [Saguinus oedipus]
GEKRGIEEREKSPKRHEPCVLTAGSDALSGRTECSCLGCSGPLHRTFCTCSTLCPSPLLSTESPDKDRSGLSGSATGWGQAGTCQAPSTLTFHK